MWIDDDGTVSSMWVSGSFRLLPWRARWALWTAELDELADDVTALETAVGNAASCRREWPDQSAYRMREIPRELRGGFRGLRDFADVREHLLSFPLALSMQWQTDAVQVAVDVVDTVRRSTRRRLLARGARIAASRLRIPVIGRSSRGVNPWPTHTASTAIRRSVPGIGAHEASRRCTVTASTRSVPCAATTALPVE
ncbi:hypothetical protein [Clavibacter michiganensis]|uniref:hypothetical protein n=1 Tax=Clavibacter michiganensis TaxID=28447 RepID=UPI0029305CEE|nr:hypothetical protein [Clavibacter michiganensis]